MVIKIRAYHGTSKYHVDSILKKGFNESSKGWFGTGIYFYEDSYEMAYEWAAKKHSNDTMILKAEIEVDDKKLFDLTDPLSGHARAFHKVREDKFKKFKVKYRDQLDNIVINSMHKIWGFHVVRGFSHSFESYDSRRKLGSNVPNGIEIVVRNEKCIKSLNKLE